MFDLPIFIAQIHGYQTAPDAMNVLTDRGGDHANEFETALVLHIAPDWVAPLDTAGPGATTPSKLPAPSTTPGVWAPREWAPYTDDTGAGDPRAATAANGKTLLDALANAIAPALLQLSQAQRGDFPFVIRER